MSIGDIVYTYRDDLGVLQPCEPEQPNEGLGVLYYDTTATNGERVKYAKVAGGLQIDNGMIQVYNYGVIWSNVQEKPNWLNNFTGQYAQLSDIPGSFPPAGHSHVYSDISNFATGVRAALELSTSGTSGAATYDPNTGVFNIPNYKVTRTFNNNVSRSLNSNFTISTTRDARISYSINASWTVNALLSGTGTAFFEYSTDSGSNWITVNQVSKTLNLLTVAGADDMNLVGEVPANALCRIRTTSTNMTIAYTRGQEVLQ